MEVQASRASRDSSSATFGLAISGALPPPHSSSPPRLLGVSIDVDLYAPSLEALRLLHDAALLSYGSVVHFHELVHPFGPGDHRTAHAANAAGGSSRVHPFLKKMRGISASVAGNVRNASFFWSDEQRALFDFLRTARGALWWLVPVVSDQSPESAVFVLAAQGARGEEA